MKLTQRKIEALVCEPGKRDRMVADDDQRGLMVRVTAAGSKTYLAQFTVGGTKRRVPLGSCAAISLAAAREAAAGIMGEVAKGNDPAADRKAAATAQKAQEARDALTLAVLIADWDRLHLDGRAPRYRTEAVRALKVAFTKHLDLPAAALDRKAVVKVLDGLSAAGSASMASRTAAYGRACYQWAMKRGSLEANPFTLLPVAETEKRDRVLSDEELVAVWNSADPATTFGAIVRTLILTGQRREEVGGMTWDEIAPDLTLWTIPRERAKNDQAHRVPLSAPVADLLRTRPRLSDCDHVFFGRHRRTKGEDGADAMVMGPFNGWSKSKERLDAASGVKDWRLHDLRRTMATGLQRLGVRLEVTEAVLNHVAGSRAGIVGVYQRHTWADEKRAALDAWAARVMGIVDGRTAAPNVVAMEPRRRTRA